MAPSSLSATPPAPVTTPSLSWPHPHTVVDLSHYTQVDAVCHVYSWSTLPFMLRVLPYSTVQDLFLFAKWGSSWCEKKNNTRVKIWIMSNFLPACTVQKQGQTILYTVRLQLWKKVLFCPSLKYCRTLKVRYSTCATELITDPQPTPFWDPSTLPIPPVLFCDTWMSTRFIRIYWCLTNRIHICWMISH